MNYFFVGNVSIFFFYFFFDKFSGFVLFAVLQIRQYNKDNLGIISHISP